MKAIKDQRIRQVEALNSLKPEVNQELKSTESLFQKK